MKHNKAIAILALTSLSFAALPAPLVVAQAAAQSVRLSASRGQAEYLDANGRWERLKGPLNAAEGTAVRTAPGAELLATFNDGSSLTLGEASAMRFTRLSQSETGVRMLGQLTASISPRRVQDGILTVDMPVARATINRAFATARAVREDVASTVAAVQLQTPTGRAVRMAVNQGAATLHPLYNIVGVVTSTDPAHGTFTITENNTGRAHRVAVGQDTLLAQASPQTARAVRTPQQVVEGLSVRVPVIVYGDSPAIEGPGDGEDAQDTTDVITNAKVIFPEGNDYISGEQFVNQTATWVSPSAGPPNGTYAERPVGPGVAVTAGHTGLVVAGSLAPTVVAGVATGVSVASAVAPAAGAIGSAVIPVIAAVAVGSAIAIVAQQSNTGHLANNNVSPVSNTGNLVVTVQRGIRGRSVRGRIDTGATPIASTSLGTSILASTAFRGSATGPTFTSTGGDTPGLVGRFPINNRLQVHLGATVNRADMFSNMMEVDMGVDYLLDATHSLGAGLRSQSFNLMDPIGNASTMSTSTPEVRYTIRY